MNQLMALDRVQRVDYAERNVTPRRNGKTTPDDACDDVAIAALSCLRSCQIFELKQLECEFQAGILIIRGQVSSYYLKQLAQEAVRSLTGVNRIVNRLDVLHVEPNRVDSGEFQLARLKS